MPLYPANENNKLEDIITKSEVKRKFIEAENKFLNVGEMISQDLDMGNNIITNLKDGNNDDDSITKNM